MENSYFSASEISNNFAIEAARSYFAARYIYLGGMSIRNKAGYLAHSTIEQYLKAIICKYDPLQAKEISKKLHNLTNLLPTAHKATNEVIFTSSNMREIVSHFDSFDQVGRYGANAKFDPLAKIGKGIDTKGVWVMAPYSIQKLDYIVMICRKYVRIAPIHLDVVAQIKAKNKRSEVWKNWILEEISPDDVLCYDNEFLKEL
jgi:hypothetical protein